MAARDKGRLAVGMRWTARILSILIVGTLLAFFIGEGGGSGFGPLTWAERLGLVFFPVGIVLGMAVAWWREGLGAAISIGSLVVFYVVDIVTTGTPPSGPFFILFTLPAAPFAAAWALSKGRPDVPATA